MLYFSPALLLLLLLVAVGREVTTRTASDQYYVGVGIGDITGPAAEVNMMGYGTLGQTTKGIHMRLYARAFIFSDSETSTNRFVFVSADMGMMSQLVKLEVINRLRVFYGSLYSASNVILSATHTHSATAGFFQYFLFQITSLGFVRESEEQYVRGIVAAIVKAHNSIRPAYLYLNNGTLSGASINRSPTAYLMNPAAERAKYKTDVDQTMHLLRINDASGNAIGMINWFPVHGVCMKNTNHLISGDNKGYASQKFERTMEPNSLAGRNKFVAAFAQSFEGDVSSNTAGSRCIDTGLPCDPETSTCNGDNMNCIAFGPGRDMVESTQIIGEMQFQKAYELFNSATETGIQGGIRFVHKYVKMSSYKVDLGNGTSVKTCIPSLGYSFAAGSTDGVGISGFSQGVLSGNHLIDGIRNILQSPTREMTECHKPKPILIPTGIMNTPYPWHPSIVDVQMAKIGQLVVVAVPGEFTTMAGRRLIDAVTKVFAGAGQTVKVVIAGLSNVYTQYITTPEEYSSQRYEGASTIYGPNTLPAYIQLYKELASAIISGAALAKGPKPRNLKRKQWSLLPGVRLDSSGTKRFGELLRAPRSSYRVGSVVTASFVGGHPRNSMGTKLGTFMHVDKMSVRSTSNNATYWQTIFTDAEWETRFMWQRDSSSIGVSRVTLEWIIPLTQPAGTYRMCYFGHRKDFLFGIQLISVIRTANFNVIR